MSKSQVSRLARSLDELVEAFSSRPLDAGPYPYLVLDALELGCRDGGRTVNACVVHAVAVNKDGFRESLGLDLVTSEDRAAWLASLRSLVARGLRGVRLVTSDAHPGLLDTIQATLNRDPGHAQGSGLAALPDALHVQPAHPRPQERPIPRRDLVRSIFAQPDPASVHEQHHRIVCQLERHFPQAAALLDEASAEILAFTDFPKQHWRQLWSNNSLERMNKEIRRRTDVVGIFPNRSSIVRPVGAVLAEQHDEWAVARRYMSAESIAKALAEPVPQPAEAMAIEAAA